ncbi:hypothetical protein AB0K09_02465 [Streptomyces sp. NPDC049577]|uniref:hypothetical protein n=1 Tax=Streptomyces sp. NPDC049577 TaxID=3155153 RepID=UPI00341A9C3D
MRLRHAVTPLLAALSLTAIAPACAVAEEMAPPPPSAAPDTFTLQASTGLPRTGQEILDEVRYGDPVGEALDLIG